jgi:hypothetical protein
VFDDRDQMTQDLMTDEGVNAARAQFYKNGGQQVDWWGSGGHPDGVPDPYAHGVGLTEYTREFIIQSSWTTTFIGSYLVEIENNGDGTATFIGLNTSGFESATHIPFTNYENPTFEEIFRRLAKGDVSVLGYLPNSSPSGFRDFMWGYMPTALLEDRHRSESGPGGNMYQIYTWSEPIPERVLEDVQ